MDAVTHIMKSTVCFTKLLTVNLKWMAVVFATNFLFDADKDLVSLGNSLRPEVA